MEMPKRYKILVSKDAMQDIKNTKEYILNTFHYRAYAENFSKKIREAIEKLEPFPFACEDAECSIVLLLAVFVLALPKTFAKNCSHVLPHNGLKFGTSQDAKL